VSEVLVAVLAGGRGARLGEPKAVADLGGRPLIAWPLAAAAAAGLPAIVVAKASTQLPALDVPVLIEPERPQHPLAGLVRALEEGGPVLAVGCDMPFLAPAVLAELAAQVGTAVVFGDDPFPGRYGPAALPVLRAALQRSDPVRRAVAELAPLRLPGRDMGASVNTPEDLRRARERLRA
jgi:molybdopterin-guanine dinucleotide biosynthesis protein A